MAVSSLLSLTLCLLVFFHGCFAQVDQQLPWQSPHQQQQQQQQQDQRRQRARGDCRIEKLNPQEASRRVKSEAGVTEIWDEDSQQLQCAGVSVVRHLVQSRGLVLPSYSNPPRVSYVVQGRGLVGVVLPGCAETYQSGSRSSTGEQRSRDRHQKVREVRQGDVIVEPAGATVWKYNNGDQPLIIVSVYDTSNDQNQLDQNVRKFYLAGTPDEQLQRDRRREQGSGQQEKSGRNVFSGLDEQVLADAFDVETQLAQKLRGSNDGRGNIVRVRDGLEIPSPQSREEEERQQREQRGGPNGIEETLCTVRLVQNIADPFRADVYNPRGGRITTLNSQVLPVLNHVQLSAERGVLYRNGILAPQYNINSHSVVYVTKGNGRVQIVDENARTVYDGEVRQGQVVVIPQNFVVVKRASNQGLEWVAVKTTDNAMISPLAGRLSVVRGLPEEVLMNSYQISREDARRLKYNREEVTVFGPGSRSQ